MKIAGRSIGDVVRFSIRAAAQFFDTLALSERDMAIGRRVLKEIRERLGFLGNVGLDYLTPGPLRRHALGRGRAADSPRHPDRLQPGRRALHPRRAIDRPPSAGQPAPPRHAQTASGPRQHGARRGARRGDHPLGGLRGRPRARGGGEGRLPGGHRHPRRDHGQHRLAHRTVPRRRRGHRRAAGAPGGGRQGPHHPRAPGAQPEGHGRPHPARDLHLHHRGVGIGQVHPGERHPVPGARPDASPRPGAAGRPRPHRGGAAPGQGDRHRPVADRTHAAVQSGHLHRRVHPDPDALRPHVRRPGARLSARPLLVQRQGGPLRGVPGRRAGQDRDALPAGRVRDLRGVPGQALQPGDARGPLQGPEHRRGARHDGGGGPRGLRPGARHRREAPDAARRRARLHPARAGGDDPVGGRGAAGEARHRAEPARHRAHALHPGRAHDRPALRRHPPVARGAEPARGAGQHRGDHRAQPRRHQDGGLGHRPRSRGRRRGRASHRQRHPRGRGAPGRGVGHRRVPPPRAGGYQVRLLGLRRRYGSPAWPKPDGTNPRAGRGERTRG